MIWLGLFVVTSNVSIRFYSLYYLTFLLKNFGALPRGAASIFYSVAAYLRSLICLKYFNFINLITLIDAITQIKFRFRPCAVRFVFPFVLGLQRWECFLNSARSFFYFFRSFNYLRLLPSSLLFSASELPCAALLFKPPFCLGLQRCRFF